MNIENGEKTYNQNSRNIFKHSLVWHKVTWINYLAYKDHKNRTYSGDETLKISERFNKTDFLLFLYGRRPLIKSEKPSQQPERVVWKPSDSWVTTLVDR